MKLWEQRIRSKKRAILAVCDSNVADLYKLCDGYQRAGFNTIPVLTGSADLRSFAHDNGVLHIGTLAKEGFPYDDLAGKLREGTYIAASDADIADFIATKKPDALLCDWYLKSSPFQQAQPLLTAARASDPQMLLLAHGRGLNGHMMMSKPYRDANISAIDVELPDQGASIIRHALTRTAPQEKPKLVIFDDEVEQLDWYQEQYEARGYTVTPVLVLPPYASAWAKDGHVNAAALERIVHEMSRADRHDREAYDAYDSQSCTRVVTSMADVEAVLNEVKPDAVVSDYRFGNDAKLRPEDNPSTGIDLLYGIKAHAPELPRMMHSSESLDSELDKIENHREPCGYQFLRKGYFDALDVAMRATLVQGQQNACGRA